jgi:hypothetical protein
MRLRVRILPVKRFSQYSKKEIRSTAASSPLTCPARGCNRRIACADLTSTRTAHLRSDAAHARRPPANTDAASPRPARGPLPITVAPPPRASLMRVGARQVPAEAADRLRALPAAADRANVARSSTSAFLRGPGFVIHARFRLHQSEAGQRSFMRWSGGWLRSTSRCSALI